MLDDLMDEYGKEPKKRKTTKPKKDKPPKKASKTTKSPKKAKKSTKKKRVEPEKEPAKVHGDDSTIPPIIHEYLIKHYYNVYYVLGEEQDRNTRQFRIRDTEDSTQDYTMRMNIEGGGRDAQLKEVFSNV